MAEQIQKKRTAAKSKPPIARKSEKDIQRKKNSKPAYMQAKMAVSKPGDSQEQEADRVADEISRKPRSISRQAEESVQRASVSSENIQDQEQSIQAASNISIQRTEEESLAAKIQRNEEESAAAKLMREEDEAQAKLQPAADESLATTIMPMEEEAQALAREVSEGEENEASLQATAEPSLSDDSEQRLAQRRGMGVAMQEDTLRDMENQFGADFSEVKIHTDGEADQLCKEINARAFTLGKDVFFAAGEYAPETEAGRKLLAHELTHVVQQANSYSRKVFRDTASPTSGGSATPSVTVGTLQIPRFKATRHTGLYQESVDQNKLYRPANYQRPSSIRPSEDWDDEVDASTISSAITDKIGQPEQGRTAPYMMVPKNEGNPTFIRMGNIQQLSDLQKRPNWNRRGQGKYYEVDHIVELQTNGSNTDWNNFELLESNSNGQSGDRIRRGIETTVNNFLRRSSEPEVQAIPEDKRNLASLKTGYNIKFDAFRGSISAGRGEYWTKEEIENATHVNFSRYVKILDPLYPNRGAPFSRWPRNWDPSEYVGGASTDGGPATLVIYANRIGGKSKHMEWPVDATPSQRQAFPENGPGRSSWISGFIAETISFNPETTDSESAVGTIRGELFKENPALNFNGTRAEIDVLSVPGMPYMVHADARSIEAQINHIFSDNTKGVDKASPIRVTFAGLDEEGVLVRGKLLPTIPMISDADIDLIISGNDLRLEKTFTSGDVNLPAPLSIDEATLTLAISTEEGFAIAGALDFSIDSIGEGQIRASAARGAEASFSLAGEFNFDERIFGEGTTAEVRAAYENNAWSMGGTITIPEGKVPGVTSATINVDYSETEGFSASGDASLDVPGVESGSLSITHSEEVGFVIGGTFNLSADTPGIRGGSISATLQEKEDGSGFAVSARGEAQPDIPGINSNLAVEYDDGAFTAEVDADYARGMLSGRVNAGVTNRSVDENGELSETAAPENSLIVYGGGSLTLQLAPWLQGTAGVQFAPNGEITVNGEIGLPDELEIFRRYEVDRRLLSVAAQYPIVPAVVAEIGGNLSAEAGIGPGTLNELSLGVTYNPDREEDTTIRGNASLRVPADAGLRLGIRVGLGLGVPGASVTGGLEISGTLGLEAEAAADVQVEWSPSAGLDIEANLRAHVEPAFTFGIDGYVNASVLGASVYDDTFEFASYTFGSDYRFGLELPVHYQEGEDFDVSYDDIVWTIPDIDANQLLRNLVARIT